LKIAHILAFAILASLKMASLATAQNPPSGPNLKESDDSIAFTAPIAPVMLPDKPVPLNRKVLDKKFIAVMGTLAGAETLRFTTHKLVLDNEFAAGAPWVTHVPDNKNLIGKYSAIFAAEMLLTYELKRPHSWLPGDKYIRKLWLAYPAVMTTIHIKNGVRSIRTQAPAGSDCPPEYAQYCQ